MRYEVEADPANHQFKIFADGNVAGRLTYAVDAGDATQPEKWTLDGTEVDPQYRGRGVASVLVTESLEMLRGQWVKVVPTCPYVIDWFERHPDYRDFLDPAWEAPWDQAG